MDQKILQLNEEGFIPGPEESEENFFKRVEEAKKTFQQGGWIPETHWNWVKCHVKDLFDFEPRWVAAFYSNKSLMPWQGAATWIDAISIVQLREGFRKGRYLGLYSREEILAHEAVHAARAAFNEENYEEFFAYLTSEKKWRKVLGPLIRRPWEIWPFFIAVLGGEFLHSLFFTAAALWVSLGLVRLIGRHNKLKKAGKKILQEVKSPRIARSVLFRLTDREIERFAKKGKVREYAEKQNCLRWNVIQNAYLKEGMHG